MSYSKPRPVGYYRPGLGAPMPYPLKGMGAPMPYPLRGLGDGGDESYRYGRRWELICFPAPGVRQLLRDMHAWNAEQPTLGESDQSNDFKEDFNPVRGLKLLWIRMGKNDNWWPGMKPEHFNFGPTTYSDDCPGGHRTYIGGKPANTLRVDQEFWGEMKARQAQVKRETTPATPYPAALWRPHSDGYVRLRYDDPLLAVIKANLVAGGYLAPQDTISVKDDSRFVGESTGNTGLKRYFLECARREYEGREPNGTCGRWPSGLNFGPNTATDELRVDSTLLFRLLNLADPRAAVARERSQTVLRGMRVKSPLFGGLPPVRPGGRLLATNVASSQLLTRPVQVNAALVQALRLSGLKGFLR